MAGITVKIDGYADVIRALNRLAAPRMKDLAGFLGEEVLALSAEAFEETQDPVTGRAWKPSRRASHAGGKTLTESADLRRSLEYIAYPDGSMIAGSPSVYARIHNDGGQAGPGRSITLPQRRYLGWPADLPRRLLEDRTVQNLLGVGA